MIKAVQKYPHTFVGSAYFDPREEVAIEKLRSAIENHDLQGVKYGPLYNGLTLDDLRMDPLIATVSKIDPCPRPRTHHRS